MIAVLNIFAGAGALWNRRDQYQPQKHRAGPRRTQPARGDSVEISQAGYSLAHPEETAPPVRKR